MEKEILTTQFLENFHESISINASSLILNLPQPPKLFFRHGWQSWSLASWLTPSDPPLPIRSPEFRAKDEDPVYAFHKNHISASVGAVEMGDNDILLVGGVNLNARVELIEGSINAFYEEGLTGDWFVARGTEDEVFAKYTNLLQKNFGQTHFSSPPRVWCSWYSLYKWINESILLDALGRLGNLPFDVFQIDDGWQDESGHWNAGRKFPSGMSSFAAKIKSTGRKAGLWLSPFLVSPNLKLFQDHPDWILKNENGYYVSTGLNWTGQTFAIDVSRSDVLDWVSHLIHKIVGWGYEYLKIDFLYAAAVPGKRHKDIPREDAYRNAMKTIREAAGNDIYILACGAPIIPSLGICDGIRVGPDVSPFWINKAHTIWLNNPNDTSTQNSIRTSLHRLWLKELIHVDPDVLYFRSKHNKLLPYQTQLLKDLGTISGFKATSDLPQWLSDAELISMRDFLESSPQTHKYGRYQYKIEDRLVDFSDAIPIAKSELNLPVWLAKYFGLLKVVWLQVIPSLMENLKKFLSHNP